jgi:hypothetical protein
MSIEDRGIYENLRKTFDSCDDEKKRSVLRAAFLMVPEILPYRFYLDAAKEMGFYEEVMQQREIILKNNERQKISKAQK